MGASDAAGAASRSGVPDASGSPGAPSPTPADGWLARWTRAMIRFRWLVVGVWIAVLVGSVAATRDLGDLLKDYLEI